MAKNGDDQPVELTEEAMLVVELTKTIFSKDMDETHRILGRYMDKYRLQISKNVIGEYEVGRRIKND